jgi:hypothetical protein
VKQTIFTRNTMNIYRAHESSQHPEGKWNLGRLLSHRRFLVLYEHMLADVVAFRASEGVLRVVCAEHELTRRNMRRNVERNFANGCAAMVMLVPDESARAAARRLLRREFSRSVWIRIGILTHDICQRVLAGTTNFAGVTATSESQIVKLTPGNRVAGLPGRSATQRHATVKQPKYSI